MRWVKTFTEAPLDNELDCCDPSPYRSATVRVYDANGNLLSTGNLYDVEHRLRQANMPGGTIQYLYDGQNKRIWQGQFTNSNDPQMLMQETVAMFGADGKLAATYTPQPAWNNTQNQVPITFTGSTRVYFAGKLIKQNGGNVVQDRLGTVGKFYPYGEQRDSTGAMFATYTRDSATNLDYADQRYYASTFGRFMTSDPYKSSGGPSDPQSWNQYAYARGDAVNYFDPTGQYIVVAPGCDPWDASCEPCDPYDYYCNPSPYPVLPLDPGLGGGGGDMGDAFYDFDTLKGDVRNDLGKKDCYTLLGFASAKAAQDWFDRSIAPQFHFQSYGRLHMAGPGTPAGDPYPQPANTLGYGQININTDYNWSDFSKVTTDTGRTENYLNDMNRLLKRTMDSEQLATLIIIHELGHQETAPKQPAHAENAAEKQAIYDNCIKK